MAPYSFDGKVALVTGSGSGIGRATCLLLARDAARVMVTDANLEAAQETLSLMPRPEDHLALQLDVIDRGTVEAAIKAARARYGAPPSLLVNSAGIGMLTPFLNVDEDLLNRVIDINLKGTFVVSQVMTEALLGEGGGEGGEGRGAVVNISSMAGKTGQRGLSAYAASKGGILALTKTCAAELAPKGIRVNCVLPGLIDTTMAKQITEDLRRSYNSKNPLGRLGRSEEVAEAVVFLLSERSSYMVGACVEVSGGTDM